MKQSLQYQRASIFRRICSAIFDLVIFLAFFVVFQSFVVNPIVINASNYNSLYSEYVTECISTHLFEYSSSNDDSIVYTQQDATLKQFYVDGILGYTIADYNELKAKATYTIDGTTYNLFTLDSNGEYVDYTDTDTTINSTLTTQRQQFYYDLAQTLFEEYENSADHAEFKAKVTKLSNLIMLMYSLSAVLATLFNYLLFPMIFKDRDTLGKKMFHFQLIDTKTGKMASRFQAFARFVYFAIIYLALPGFIFYVFSMIIGLFLEVGLIATSICTVCLTKNRQTLHDLVAHTTVVTNTINETAKDEDVLYFEYDDGKPEEDEANDDSYQSNSFDQNDVIDVEANEKQDENEDKSE